MSVLRSLLKSPAYVQLTRTRNLLKTSPSNLCYSQSQTPGLYVLVAHQRRPLYTGAAISRSHLSDPENKGTTQKGINFDTLGVWNNRLDLSISVEKSIEKGKLIPEIPLDEVGVASLLGRRKVNEDRYTVKQLTDNLTCFAIFDGHAGSMAVDFVHEHLEHAIMYWLTTTKNLSEVLRKSFIDVNNLLARYLAYCPDIDSNTGTTATVCLLRDNIEMVVANVGDSRAILCRSGEAIRLSKDHTPDNAEEKKRIKAAGGYVTDNSYGVPHVNGRLTMTRSIGDLELKSYGVTAEPHIRSIGISHGRDSFLILATDGVTFVLSDQELVDTITSCADPSEGAFLITDQALQFGSEDNATAVVVPFGAWGKYRSSTRSIPYSFGRNMFSSRS